MKSFIMQTATAWLALFLLSVFSSTAQASLANDLQGLLGEANVVNAQLVSTNLTADNMCSELHSINSAFDSLISATEVVNGSLSAPLSVDADSLQALDDLSAVLLSMAGNSSKLSVDLGTLNSVTDMLAISNAMSSMLQLSNDIGTMADRILEMADKILIMANNIGLMADRIIITQQIQSDNLALTQASILTTQQNLLALVSVINSSDYNAAFNAQTASGNLLSMNIGATSLTVFNMASQWSDIATDINSLKAQIETTHDAIKLAAASNTVYVDTNSYAALADMGIMVSSVSIAVQGLALATEGLSPLTGNVTLSDSMGSILQLSADIGVMADRILEMGNLILAMADNIGLTADQIIATQQLQNANYAATLASVQATQEIALTHQSAKKPGRSGLFLVGYLLLATAKFRRSKFLKLAEATLLSRIKVC